MGHENTYLSQMNDEYRDASPFRKQEVLALNPVYLSEIAFLHFNWYKVST
ncbi:hypothetical protein GCM10009409_02620 [Shewanella saliphila]|uniref:Uncharacterized protein n=1 Tax=Shewanella saliphila TaxID=2282698 RepID=A0ABQ2Q2U5_9GAMM|nr:hypothetical protein GCM10009409_02620 [Shewanella saliphila]